MQVRWRRPGGAWPSGAPGGRRDRTEDYRFLPQHAAGAFSKVGDGAFSKVGDNEVVAGVAADGSSNAVPRRVCASSFVVGIAALAMLFDRQLMGAERGARTVKEKNIILFYYFLENKNWEQVLFSVQGL